jgi:methionine synthase II (cobalamin-independent)
METGHQSRNLDVAHFGSFPSVNPVLKQKIDQNKRDLEESALSVACARGEYESVKKLIEQGVDVNTKDQTNLSPIMRAATNGHKKIVKFLVNSGAKISYNLLCSVKTKIELMEEKAQRGSADPYDVADWKNFLEYLISEGKKQ